MEKYIVTIETKDTVITLNLYAEDTLDMYRQSNNIDKFKRIVNYYTYE